MRGRDKLLVVILFILVDISLIGGILLIRSSTSKNIFENEIEELASFNFTTDRYNTSIETIGDYGRLEIGIKKYFDSYAVSVQDIFNNVDKDLLKLFSVDNYEKDGPLFLESFKKIETRRNNYIRRVDNVINNYSADMLLDNIKDFVGDNEYFNIAEELINEYNFVGQINDITLQLESKKIEANSYYDAIYDVFYFLRENNTKYSINNENIIFTDDVLANKYNELCEKAKRIYY